MSINTEGWAVELTGPKFDLDNMRDWLVQPFDPWVEDYKEGESERLLLRTEKWKQFSTAAEVRTDASRILLMLNGAALLVDDQAKALELGQVMKFGADGKRERVLFAKTGHLSLTPERVRMRATSNTGGTPVSIQESLVQKWLGAADSNANHAELLIHLHRADNWYDIYKCMELLRSLIGDSMKMKSELGSDWDQWELVWRTANCHRHAPDQSKYPLPVNRPGLADARTFVPRTVSRVLQQIGS